MKAIVFFICFLAASAAMAEGSVSGYLGAGMLFINSDDNTMVSGKSNSRETDRFNDQKAIFMGELKAKLSERTTFHAGIPQDSFLPELSAGLEINTPGETKVDISGLYDAMGKAWKNPYADHRETTGQTSYGGRIGLSSIAGSNVFADVTVKKHTVDDDLSGDLYSTLGRDGTTVSVSSGVRNFKDNVMTSISGELGRDNCHGDAESSNYAGVNIFALFTLSNSDRIGLGIRGTADTYGEKNPYFNKTRNDSKLAAYGAYTFVSPFGFKNEFIKLSAGYIKNYSNIDYFDSSTFLGSVTAGINF